MENLGFIFGMMGMSMGVIGFIFGVISMTKIDKLEKRLKEFNIYMKISNPFNPLGLEII